MPEKVFHQGRPVQGRGLGSDHQRRHPPRTSQVRNLKQLFKNSSPRHGGYFGPKETPYAAVLSAQEKQIAGVIVHLQVTLSLKYFNLTFIQPFDFFAGGNPLQPPPDHGSGENQHFLSLDASK